ncbi:hypothetical protein [Bradyrhizobium erythrophlei]|uniref:hypothetical protein n=1 Tax=Bradyrhizobium erythrophlei TaxID=1437360 RepID=UPI00115FC974|nr:hypothetical protein [Bradyrhizobium erythrophlei]
MTTGVVYWTCIGDTSFEPAVALGCQSTTMARRLRGRYLCVVECRDMIDLELRTRMIMLTFHLDDQYDRFT